MSRSRGCACSAVRGRNRAIAWLAALALGLARALPHRRLRDGRELRDLGGRGGGCRHMAGCRRRDPAHARLRRRDLSRGRRDRAHTQWVTQQDVDLARAITDLAAERQLAADPAAVTAFELGLDVADSASVAPFWAALLTGDPAAQGRGTPGDEIRDAGARVPNLWFGDADPKDTARQRVHIEVYVAPEVAEQRLAAAVAVGGSVVDDSEAPGLVVLADPEGNRGVLCADPSSVASA